MIITSILLLVLVADQLTKYIVKTNFQHGESIPVWRDCFSLTYVGNTGAAWGLFPGQNHALILLSIVTIVVMFVFRRSFATTLPLQKIAVGLILGGIFGNLIDRMFRNEVVDFLDFYWRGNHWPAFNIADSAICIGAFLYIGCALWPMKRHTPKAPPNHAAPASSEVITRLK